MMGELIDDGGLESVETGAVLNGPPHKLFVLPSIATGQTPLGKTYTLMT